MKLYAARAASWQTLLAQVLERQYGLSPLPELARTDQGKPYFPSLPHLHFNISHTGPYVLCALSRHPVGVDMETIRPRRPSLPAYALSPQELAAYEGLGGDWPAFYTLWTKKEAWCKYTGQGLAALWGQAPQEEGLFYGHYQGESWRAAVCGKEPAPAEIHWLEGAAP